MIEQPLTIEVYSDVVCPWCYVGKRRLERALARLNRAVDPRVIWKPFELNPTMPEEGMGRTTYLEAKFGSLDAFQRLEGPVVEAGAAVGIAFAFEKIARTPNTLLAHRLIWHAAQQGLQNAVVDSLFHGYFEEGADIGSLATLVQLAGRAGLSAEPFLHSDAGTVEVKAEEAAGLRLGIRAVPYFVLNGIYGISGAQPVDVFAAAMQTATSQPAALQAKAPAGR